MVRLIGRKKKTHVIGLLIMGYAEKLYEITRNKVNKCPLNKLIMEEIMEGGNSERLSLPIV